MRTLRTSVESSSLIRAGRGTFRRCTAWATNSPKNDLVQTSSCPPWSAAVVAGGRALAAGGPALGVAGNARPVFLAPGFLLRLRLLAAARRVDHRLLDRIRHLRWRASVLPDQAVWRPRPASGGVPGDAGGGAWRAAPGRPARRRGGRRGTRGRGGLSWSRSR